MLKTKIKHDNITKKICDVFTLDHPEEHIFEPHFVPHELIPDNFSTGLIVGSSGSGKSLLLNEFGKSIEVNWDDRAIASHFKDYEDCEKRLLGAGLNSVPIWLCPYKILSNGQRYRADVARNLQNGAVFDEFTSVIDRQTAKSLSNSVKNYVVMNNLKGLVFACPHHDVEEYLEPDWCYDTDTKILSINKNTHKPEVHYLDKKYIKIDNEKKVHFMEFEV